MHRFHRSHIRIRQQGQTLIIALIVLGVLLILGLVFLGLINRNIQNSARSQRRSEATDLAEAGIRYAHSQLVTSPLGADWRGVPTTLAVSPTNPDFSGDPDAYYLRPGFRANSGGQSSGIADDLGGPDKLGPFVRIPFPGGRALVRVRYGATDANPTAEIPGGPLRNPGAAKATIIIESIGRPGVINDKDPTTYSAQGGLRFKNFADNAALVQGLALMAQTNGQVATSRRLTAFAPIGIIDFARFETNVFNSSAPIEMGIPDGLGAYAFNDVAYNNGAGTVAAPTEVGSNLAAQYGTSGELTRVVAAGGRNVGRGGGSMMFNGDVRFYGRNNIYLNRTLGESVRAAGRFLGGVGAALNITPVQYNPVSQQYESAGALPPLTAGGSPSFDSQNPGFDTQGGLILDGSPRTDRAGYASGIGQLVPPSAFSVDPDTKQNRYVTMTRESGETFNSNNLGEFGYGRGVYVNNTGDRQEPSDSDGRSEVGSQRSLFDDWIKPNSGAANSGWKGPFYVPRGAVVQLLPDGFSIQRDRTNPNTDERTWRKADGNDSGASTIRYRLGTVNGQLRIVNTFTPGVPDINVQNIDFTNSHAMPFNGVLYFEGNVRVRGTIPTNVQLTLVSGATVYIEGSILKGVTNTQVYSDGANTRNDIIRSLPTASLMLIAKDNVAINTPNFFGPTATQSLEVVNDVSGATGISPVRLKAAGGTESGRLELVTELPLDPVDAAGLPLNAANLWRPYAMNYRQWDGTPGPAIATQLLLGLTMDDGTASASFIAMDVNEGTGTSAYQFVGDDGLITNTAAAYLGFAPTATMPIYGLGAEPWQRYSRFEMRAFPLLSNPTGASFSTTAPNSGLIGGQGYNLFSEGNNVLLQPAPVGSVSANDTLVGRAAMTPGDVKIEASIFAEQGSFFVIPGPWFNPNPNDTHNAFASHVEEYKRAPSSLSDANARQRASRDRLEAYGAAPFVPFYGEPLDVRVNIIGSVAENLPPPISIQAEWLRKWAWIPRRLGASGVGIPGIHVPKDIAIATQNFVPNLIVQYDPTLATGRVQDTISLTPAPVRKDVFDRPLPPMPRLPVSPKLAYFGEL